MSYGKLLAFVALADQRPGLFSRMTFCYYFARFVAVLSSEH